MPGEEKTGLISPESSKFVTPDKLQVPEKMAEGKCYFSKGYKYGYRVGLNASWVTHVELDNPVAPKAS